MFFTGITLVGSVWADETLPEPEQNFDISKYTVVVENPDYLRHQVCLGLVYDMVTVLVPEECGYRRFSDVFDGRC